MEKKQLILLAIAVLALALAGLLFYRGYQTTQPQMEAIGREDVEQEIQRIQNDPNMPPQAKQAAIDAIRSRTGVSPQGTGQ
ncbi:MAG: hypothetical protein SNJ72_06580 [Fimbriimonadales bacterium]